MGKIINMVLSFLGKFADEHIKDYREGRAIIYDGIIKTNAQINQIVLTVSVASLTAVAALNKAVLVPYGLLSFLVILLFGLVILVSVVNLYMSTIVLKEIQKKFNQNWKSLSLLNKGMERPRFGSVQRALNMLVLSSFCLGLVALLMLLGLYILGGNV